MSFGNLHPQWYTSSSKATLPSAKPHLLLPPKQSTNCEPKIQMYEPLGGHSHSNLFRVPALTGPGFMVQSRLSVQGFQEQSLCDPQTQTEPTKLSTWASEALTQPLLPMTYRTDLSSTHLSSHLPVGRRVQVPGGLSLLLDRDGHRPEFQM